MTKPVKGPALSIAAAIYKGGVQIRSLDEFLSYSVKVEEDAAVHYDQLAESMAACGNADVASLFTQLARYSRMHLEEAKAKCARYDVTVQLPASSSWPDNSSPEMTALWAGDPALTRLDGLKAALAAEVFGHVGAGRIRIDIHQHYALEDAQQAHRDLESRKTTGSSIFVI